MYTQALAHGVDLAHVDADDIATVRKPRWVTALASLRYSDLFASGASARAPPPSNAVDVRLVPQVHTTAR